MNPSNTRTVSHLFIQEQNRRHNQDARKGKMTSRQLKRSAIRRDSQKQRGTPGFIN